MKTLVIGKSAQCSDAKSRQSLSAPGNQREFEALNELKQRIITCQQELAQLVVGTLQKAIDLGLMLLDVRERVPHGQFLSWIDAELYPASGIKRRTAQRYMRLARNRHLILSRLQDLTTADAVLESNAALASGTLQRLKIADGERLAMPNKAAVENPADELMIPHTVEHALRSFIRQATGETALHRVLLPVCNTADSNESPCVFGVRRETAHLMAVQTLCHRYSVADDDMAFLWIGSHGMETWLPLLNSFPRVCVAETYAATGSPGSQYWLYGLLARSQFHAFATVGARLGDVLIPFGPAADRDHC